MAEFDDLLAGIRAHPHDELRRLVFADWLDENAHANPVYRPWASYIRWAVAADRTPRTDPDYWAYRRYPEKPPEGLTKFLGLDGQPFRIAWLCGFPDVLWVEVDTLQEHDHKFAKLVGPIRRLVVSARYHHDQSPFLPPGSPPRPELRPLPRVPTDWVSGPTVARAGSLEIGLHELDAVAVLTALSKRPAGALPPLTLRIGLADSGVAAFARLPLPSLVGLEVFGLQDPEDLARSPNLLGVKTFTLDGVPGYIGQDTSLLSQLPNLTRLNIGDAHPPFLTALAADGFPLLTHLEVVADAAGTPGWVAFTGSPGFGRLTRLRWSGRGTTDTAAPAWPTGLPEPEPGLLIVNTVDLGRLQALSLFGSPLLNRSTCLFAERCELHPDAYLALAENASARNLKVLSVQMPFKSEPFARGEPFAALCQSPHLAGLTELSLTFHDLTDEDFEELLSATFADGLRYLNLAGSYFSERVLERLTDPAVLPALTWLDIHAPTGGSRRLEPALQKRFGPNFQL